MSKTTHRNAEANKTSKVEVTTKETPAKTHKPTKAKELIIGKWIRCLNGQKLFDTKNPKNGLFDAETTILQNCRIFVDSDDYVTEHDTMVNCRIFVNSDDCVTEHDTMVDCTIEFVGERPQN